MNLPSISFILVSLFVAIVRAQECTVTIQNGTIIGATLSTANPSKKVCSYTAIPYASPPIGHLRFKPPKPAQAWGTLNATRQPNWCPQAHSDFTPLPEGAQISEDCLYLNVYQPQLAEGSTGLLPVMIWIHGGAFVSGSASLYTPERLLARGDVILVVVQYRLGLLGFLSTNDEVSPGNYGLKDQAYSIRWVNENIKEFGGNPEQVTIFGQSAGGASVVHQVVSPLNKGLIQGAIAHSGTALATWGVDKFPKKSAQTMAKRLGCPSSSSLEIVLCLRGIEWEKIIQQQGAFTQESYHNLAYPYATMTPVVEPDLPGAFISQTPMEIMKSGDLDNYPVVLGATEHDGSFILAVLYLTRYGPLKEDTNASYMRNEIVPGILKLLETGEDAANRATASSIEMAYLSTANRSSWSESMPGLVDIVTVYAFKSSIQHSADLLSARGRNVYLYSFEHHSQNTLWTSGVGALNPPVQAGIAHADDLMYLFNLPSSFSQDDTTFSEIFCDLWLNFGRSGNPTPSPDNRYEQWPTYDTQNELYMKLNITPTVVTSGYRSSWRPNGFDWN